MKIEKGPFAGKSIEYAPSDKIGPYEERLFEMIRECFGIDALLITDESTLGDFDPEEEEMEKVRVEYDSEAQVSDTLLDVALRIWGKK